MNDAPCRIPNPTHVIVRDPITKQPYTVHRCRRCGFQLAEYKGCYQHTHDIIKDSEIIVESQK
jgi:hypothetical protein